MIKDNTYGKSYLKEHEIKDHEKILTILKISDRDKELLEHQVIEIREKTGYSIGFNFESGDNRYSGVLMINTSGTPGCCCSCYEISVEVERL